MVLPRISVPRPKDSMTGPFCSFFQLRDNPFRANPDPRYLFLTADGQRSVEEIMEGIRACRGLLLLTGEVGTGKTVLIHRLLERLAQQGTPRAFIFNSHLNVNELFELILAEFGIPFVAQRGTPLAHLNSWLHDRFRAGQTPVLFVDEAQGLRLRVLEELRLLLNLQTSQGNLLQIVLSGQPEFEETLRRPELRQIRQRVALRCRTSPLTLDESRAYIESRLRFAGASGSQIFDPEAVQALFLYSRGIPRVLNLLCEQSLMRAASENIRPVPGCLVGAAAQEFQYDGGRTFVPSALSDEAFFSGHFAPQPVRADAPEFPSAASINDDAHPQADAIIKPSLPVKPLAAAAAGVFQSPSQPHTFSPQLARMSGTLQSSSAPIMFPSPSLTPSPLMSAPKEAGGDHRHIEIATSAEQFIAELSAVSSVMASPPSTEAKVSDQMEGNSARYWKRDAPATASQIRAASAAIKAKSHVLFGHLRAAVARLYASASWQLRAWRDEIRHAAVSFDWPDFAASWLQWLREPSGVVRRHHTDLKSHGAASATASPFVPAPSRSVKTSQPQQNRPRSGTSQLRSKLNQAQLQNNPRIASILYWLQQPTGSRRNRRENRPSNTRIA